ncbi:MAG: hypothetical protein JNM08_14670 [Rubrivivax sp.]|nr:hypothetical protein [Rubrivivax sp.]
MQRLAYALLASTTILSACGGGGGGGGGGEGAPSAAAATTISPLRLTAQSVSTLSFSWTGTGAAQYRVFRGGLRDATKQLLASTTQTTFTDTGLGFKEGYTYEVAACRKADDPDQACPAWSGPLESFVALQTQNGTLYGLALPQVDTATLAADFGLIRVGARWVFSDPADPVQRTTLDYTVRQITAAGARLHLTAQDPTDPQTNIGEIGIDGRLGLYIVGVEGSTPSKTFPFVATADFSVPDPLLVAAAPSVGQSWTHSTNSSTHCDRLDGSSAICDQRVQVTTRVRSHGDTFAGLCPRSPAPLRSLLLKPFKLEVTHEYQALDPAAYRSLPTEVREYWLSPGLGYVAARRTVLGSSSSPLLLGSSGNHCLVAASGQ